MPNLLSQIEPSSVALPDHLEHTSKGYMTLVVGNHQIRIFVVYLIEIEAVVWLVGHCFAKVFEEIVAGNYLHNIHLEEPVVVVPFALDGVVVDLILDNLPLAHPTIAIHIDYHFVCAEEKE